MTKEMKIKPGYKKTPVGIIPEDWEVKKLKDICGTICGEYGANERAISYRKDSPRYIRITDINDEGRLHSDSKMSVDLNEEEIIKYKLERGDLLFARTGATVGKTYLYYKESTPMVFAGFLIRFRINKEKAHPIFVREYTHTNKYWNWVKAYSARSGQPGINSSEFKNFNLPIPPLPEQKAIADCLSTWDRGIEKLAALIDAKKEQKKGLMQRLLTGSLRLRSATGEPFNEEWKEMRLGEVVKRVTKRNKELNDNVVTISAQHGFIKQEEYFKKRVASSTLTNYFLVERGDFCYNKSYSNGYPMGAIKRLLDYEKAVVTTLYICFKSKKKYRR